jgi:hypothetical protein
MTLLVDGNVGEDTFGDLFGALATALPRPSFDLDRDRGISNLSHARDMKEPWCLAASDAEAPAGTLIKQYARRWTTEPSFRDRHQGPAFWDGNGRCTLQNRKARPAAADQRVREGAADYAGGQARAWGWTDAQVQHIKDAHTVPPGGMLYELIPNT